MAPLRVVLGGELGEAAQYFLLILAIVECLHERSPASRRGLTESYRSAKQPYCKAEGPFRPRQTPLRHVDPIVKARLARGSYRRPAGDEYEGWLERSWGEFCPSNRGNAEYADWPTWCF
jgi:hypothetical protein